MAEDTGQERSESATQKRREETRQRGQVARSQEVTAAVMMFTGFITLLLFRERFVGGMGSLISSYIKRSATIDLTSETSRILLIGVVVQFFTIIYPVLLVMLAAGILINLLQIGFIFTGEPLQPKLEKIDPFAGVKRLMSRRTVETLLRDSLKVIIVGWIAYSAVKGMMAPILGLGGAEPGTVMGFTATAMFDIAMQILMGYAVLAILDYGFQRWDYENSMKMTRQEIREELKQAEGDPLLRARVRSVQREMARRRMMEEVPKAQVVITNPTEIAVAIFYERGMAAPVVVAKGRNLIAERIRERAVEAGVPIVQNIALAQALYKAVEIGRMIPADLFTAVAEVLAYVFRLKGKNVV